MQNITKQQVEYLSQQLSASGGTSLITYQLPGDYNM